MAPVRIDVWLSAARIFKSRTQAREACIGGLVKINDTSAKPSQDVKVGDEIRAQAPRGLFICKVIATAEKRLRPLARALYDDQSPPPPPKEQWMPRRERGAGRPTKADRRALDRFTGDEAEDE